MYWAIFMYLCGAVGVFFQHNIQYIIPWWKDKPMITTVVFSIPIGYFYLISWTYFTDHFKSVWSTRFLFFGLSYLVFPVLAYYFLRESPFTMKTVISTILSITIIYIQYRL
jgi:hypothetical protein